MNQKGKIFLFYFLVQENSNFKFNQNFNNSNVTNKMTGNMSNSESNDDVMKHRDDMNQGNNLQNMENSQIPNNFNLNNIVNPNVNLFNTNSSFSKGNMGNQINQNNAHNHNFNSLPQNNGFNNVRAPMQMMNFPFNMPMMHQNGGMRPNNMPMNMHNNMQNINKN